jgi:hypothetical protein
MSEFSGLMGSWLFFCCYLPEQQLLVREQQLLLVVLVVQRGLATDRVLP